MVDRRNFLGVVTSALAGTLGLGVGLKAKAAPCAPVGFEGKEVTVHFAATGDFVCAHTPGVGCSECERSSTWNRYRAELPVA